MLKATALIAGSLLLGLPAAATAETPQQLAQAQMENSSQIDQAYQNRLRAAKTPEERARIQAEYDQHMQQSTVPDSGENPVPRTPGSATLPSPPNAQGANPGEDLTGSGRIPRDQD